MTDIHRTKRCRTEDWEVFDLFDQDYRQVPNTPPGLFSQISARVKDSLCNPGVVEFLRSKVRFNHDEESWNVWRYLGGGACGTAAVWVKTNDNGEVVDELVMKEQRDYHENGEWQENEDLSQEALLQRILNQSGCENIVQLRGFKAYNIPSRRWRFYLEYAPHGNLDTLRRRYRAFNRYLPELFLWHVFSSLAQAVSAMESDSLAIDNIGGLQRLKNDFILHLDVKPENIFLGYEETYIERRYDEPWITGGLIEPLYPSVKLGDFGLAQYSFQGDEQDVPNPAANPGYLLWQGTPGFKAPEQLRYDQTWHSPQINVEDKITGKMNVWYIGKTMFDLYCLAHPGGYEDNMRAKTERQFQANDHDTLPNFDRKPFATDKLWTHSPYSKELSNLIRSCMRVKPSDRPTAHQLALDIKAVLQRRYHETESRMPYNVRGRKLYYRGNEINHMGHDEKNCGLPNTIWDYFTLLRPENNDPDEPPLMLDSARLLLRNARTDQLITPGHDRYLGLMTACHQAQTKEYVQYVWRDDLLNSSAINIENGKIIFSNEYRDLQSAPLDLRHNAGEHRDLDAHDTVPEEGSERSDLQHLQYLLEEPFRPVPCPDVTELFCAHQRGKLRRAGYPEAQLQKLAEDRRNQASSTRVRQWSDKFAQVQRVDNFKLMVFEGFEVYCRQQLESDIEPETEPDMDMLKDRWNTLTTVERAGFVREHYEHVAEWVHADRRRREIAEEQPALMEPQITEQIRNEWLAMDEHERVRVGNEYVQGARAYPLTAAARENNAEEVTEVRHESQHDMREEPSAKKRKRNSELSTARRQGSNKRSSPDLFHMLEG